MWLEPNHPPLRGGLRIIQCRGGLGSRPRDLTHTRASSPPCKADFGTTAPLPSYTENPGGRQPFLAAAPGVPGKAHLPGTISLARAPGTRSAIAPKIHGPELECYPEQPGVGQPSCNPNYKNRTRRALCLLSTNKEQLRVQTPSVH